MMLSPLQKARMNHSPELPAALQKIASLSFAFDSSTQIGADTALLEAYFPKSGRRELARLTAGTVGMACPLRVGVVLSGGQAPGGHNVIAGLYDALLEIHPDSRLFGFLNGPSGIISGSYLELDGEQIHPYRNQGGFDLLGSGRTKLETEEQLAAAAAQAEQLGLDGLVVIGGDDSNTNAALLAEFFACRGVTTSVVGVPKTIDGDLKNAFIEASFGFDSAAKTYSEEIGNILRDALSAKKYYYFIRIMGRAASHLALECALQTRPNLTFISEEFAQNGWTLQDALQQIVGLVVERAAAGKNYGMVLIPEGLIEFFPDVRALILELNALLQRGVAPDAVEEHLSSAMCDCFRSLPEVVRQQLVLERDPHGNVQVSKIETERMLIDMVADALASRRQQGEYKGKFSAQPHFCGYEGRSGFPSNFDCSYCSALGVTAALLVRSRCNGYMSVIRRLAEPVEVWEPVGVPLATMIHLERRGERDVPVIKKALVELAHPPFQRFAAERLRCHQEDLYRNPGPIQFFGPPELASATTITLTEEARARKTHVNF